MTKMFENEHVELHTDMWTKHLDRELRADIDGVAFSDHRCFRARFKEDGYEEYVVMDGDMKPVITGDNHVVMEVLIKNLHWEVKEKLDIRTMAETLEVPRVV